MKFWWFCLKRSVRSYWHGTLFLWLWYFIGFLGGNVHIKRVWEYGKQSAHHVIHYVEPNDNDTLQFQMTNWMWFHFVYPNSKLKHYLVSEINDLRYHNYTDGVEYEWTQCECQWHSLKHIFNHFLFKMHRKFRWSQLKWILNLRFQVLSFHFRIQNQHSF